jgi:cytochrome c oxidase assembly protein subunit 15
MLLTIQLAYGAFMAGLKAATAAPTWPDINGSYLPENPGSYQGRSLGFGESLVNHPIVVHFVHRNLAYLLTVLVFIWTFMAARVGGSRLFRRSVWWPSVFVLLQLVLGILTVLNSYKAVPQQWGLFEWMAEWHQVVALLLLLSLVLPLYLLRPAKSR